MAQSVKLLNYIDPDGEYLRFYTELNSDFEIGDLVFISGGNYDNTKFAIEDPLQEHAIGYEVLAVDQTSLSNAITLNIRYDDERFSNSATGFFEPLNPYKTEIELLENPDQPHEAWISKSVFQAGEFNGGNFNDGIFGSYHAIPQSEQERWEQILEEADLKSTDLDYANQIRTVSDNFQFKDVPVKLEESSAWFNRKPENEAAQWKSGIFMGGNWQFGEFTSKFSSTQTGRIQSLNAQGGIRSLLDESKYQIQHFQDNNAAMGWNVVCSGNFALLWSGILELSFNQNQIILNEIPYELTRYLNANVLIQLNLNAVDEDLRYLNSRVYTIDLNNYNNSEPKILPVLEPVYESLMPEEYEVQITVADPEQKYIDQNQLSQLDPLLLSLGLKLGNSNFKKNRIMNGKVRDFDFFNGLINGAQIQGGNFYQGELLSGRINSNSRPTIWHFGLFNGSERTAYANDLNWKNGYWLGGNWDGASNIPLESILFRDGVLTLQLHLKWRPHFKATDRVTLFFLKNANAQTYLPIWSTDPAYNLLNYQSFNIENIVTDLNNNRILLVTDQSATNYQNYAQNINFLGETVLNLNYQRARLGISNFEQGLWNNGNWQAGLLNGGMSPINDLEFVPEGDDSILKLHVESVSGLKLGDLISLSNIRIVRKFDYSSFEASTSVDDRDQVEYWQNLNQKVKILDLDPENNTISIDLNLIEISTQHRTEELLESKIIRVEPANENSITAWSPLVWQGGTFNAGVWENAIWSDGTLNSVYLKDPTVVSEKTAWRFGVWQNGTWNGGVFLSGVWENGNWRNGVMYNGWNSSEELWDESNTESWQFGDSVWNNGVWWNGQWLRGLWNDGVFRGGVMQNAGVDKIEFLGGTYQNGQSVFSNDLTTNNSQRSAPSLVFIDPQGTIQLDQASWFQKDYNIIIQDLNFANGEFKENPFNNQLFDIIGRNDSGSQIKISVQGKIDVNVFGELLQIQSFHLSVGTQARVLQGTEQGVWQLTDEDNTNAANWQLVGDLNQNSGTKDVPLIRIQQNLPILVVGKVVGIVEIADNIFWIADQTYKRIVEFDRTGSVMQMRLINQVVNDPTSPQIQFKNIRKIASAPTSGWVYILQNDEILRINKTTLAFQQLTTKTALQANFTEIENLNDWFDLLVYPATGDVPETVLIPITYVNQVSLATEMNLVQLFPDNQSQVSFITMTTPFRTFFNQLLAGNYNWNNIVIKSYATATFTLLLKLKNNNFTVDNIDVSAGGTRLLETNNLQRFGLLWNGSSWYFSDTWNFNDLTSLVGAIENNLGDEIIFTDFGVRPQEDQYRVWLLETENEQSNIYFNQNNKFVPLLTQIETPITYLDFGSANVLTLFEDNITTLIIPEVTNRIGVGNQFSNVKFLHPFNEESQSGRLNYWYWDDVTKRVLNINENSDNFYDVTGEFGVSDINFNDVKFIIDISLDRVLYLDVEDDNTKFLWFLRQALPAQRDLIGIEQNGINFTQSDSIFLDWYYWNNFVWILYQNAGDFYYDQIHVRSPRDADLDSLGNLINQQQVSKIGASNEIYQNSIRTWVACMDNDVHKIVSLDTGQTIFQSENAIVDLSFNNQNNSSVLYVTTRTEDDQYEVWRLIKESPDLNANLEWPGETISPFTTTSKDLIFITEQPILDSYQNQGNIQQQIFNLPESQFLIANTDWSVRTTQNIKKIWSESATKIWIFDSSNRLLSYQIDDSNINPTPLNEIGYYNQPLNQWGYLRNVDQLEFIQWSNAQQSHAIFIDQDLNGVNRNLRIIDLNLNQQRTHRNIETVELWNGINTIETFKSHTDQYVFESEAGTNGIGEFVPPGEYGTSEYEILSFTSTVLGNQGFMLKILAFDHEAQNYVVVTYQTNSQSDFIDVTSEIINPTQEFIWIQYDIATDRTFLIANSGLWDAADLTTALYEFSYGSIKEVERINREIWIQFDQNNIIQIDLQAESLTEFALDTQLENYHLNLNPNSQILIAQANQIEQYEINGSNLDLLNTFELNSGVDTFYHEIFAQESLPAYRTEFEIEPLYNAYNLSNNNSPYVTSRVLTNLIWQNGNFNTGGTANTAHLVSSKWMAGTFNGSWDLPDYQNFEIIQKQSFFINGTFGQAGQNAVWNGGIFLGGLWRTGEFKKGHFISEKSITTNTIAFSGDVPINRIQGIEFDADLDLLRIDVKHLNWDAIDNQYKQASSNFTKQELIKIPALFRDWNLRVFEIFPGKYPVYGQNEIILKVELPDFEIPSDWLKNQKIYLTGSELYPEFLHGSFEVINSYQFDNWLWLVVNSDFNQFAGESLVITSNRKPTISLEWHEIENIVEQEDFTSIWIRLPLINGSLEQKIQFIKNNILIESIPVLDNQIIAPLWLQVFNRSVTQSAVRLRMNNVSYIKNMLFDKVDEVQYTGQLDVFDTTILNTKYIQPNANFVNGYIHSGDVTAQFIKTSNLALDSKGFTNGKSVIRTAGWDSQFTKILNWSYDNDFLYLELEHAMGLQVQDFIWLRGFAGKYSQLIGAERSRAHEIVDLVPTESGTVLCHITNPLKDFGNSIEQVGLRTQKLMLPAGTEYEFDYAWASDSAWNGGQIIFSTVGSFRGVWNAGVLEGTVNSNFIGQWFATPESYYYKGNLFANVEQIGSEFQFEIDLANNGLNWNPGDLIRVKFDNTNIQDFWARIDQNHKIRNFYPIFWPTGNYVVELIRYSDNQDLILDFNGNVGPFKDKAWHSTEYQDEVTGWPVSEVFQLEDGNPIWPLESVSKTSIFNGGYFRNKVWRGGEFRNGRIRNIGFIWKWGLHSGGEMIDSGNIETLPELLIFLEDELNNQFDPLLFRLRVNQEVNDTRAWGYSTQDNLEQIQGIYSIEQENPNQKFLYQINQFPIFQVILNETEIDRTVLDDFIKNYIDSPYRIK